MTKTLANISLAISIMALPQIASCASSEEEAAAIRQVEMKQQEAWNRHDAKAYANLFTQDGDCVNVVGWWWKGRAEIEKKLTDAYVYVFKESTLAITGVDIR